MSEKVDLLVIGSHPDDAELVAGGTMAAAVAAGHRVGILDLSRGETATSGTAELRQGEAEEAAGLLGVSVRLNAGLPDADIQNTLESRKRVVEMIRRFRPRTVIIPFYAGRHPDHRVSSELCRDACYLSGLANFAAEGEKFRPLKVIYAVAYREDTVRLTFVVDTSEHFETKLRAIKCYHSQFDGVIQAGELFPNGQPFYDLIRTRDAAYGTLIRRPYGEPFYTLEAVKVEDVVGLDVSSF